MKQYYIIILTLLFGFTLKGANTQGNEQLARLYETKDFMALKELLEELDPKGTNRSYQHYRATILNAFTQYEESIQLIEQVLELGHWSKEDPVLQQLLLTQANNYINTFQYAKAYQTYSTLLANGEGQLEEEVLESYRNVGSIYQTLAQQGVGQQQVKIEKTTQLPIYHNPFNHIMVPLAINRKHDHFILDTGAMMSVISESSAKEMGLTIYDLDINVGTVTNIDIKTKLAVADSLYLGEILILNAVFLVSRDEDLTIAKEETHIHGILGFPIVNALKELRIGQNRLEIPKTPTSRSFTNLYMQGQIPVVEIESEGLKLRMALDTGANKSELSSNFYKRHKEKIMKSAVFKKSKRGGAGGVIEENTYLLPLFNYRLGSRTGSLPSISINLTDYEFLQGLDGNLGQDAYTHFNQMVINFKTMFVDLE